MADWSDGYVTNIEYTSGLYARAVAAGAEFRAAVSRLCRAAACGRLHLLRARLRTRIQYGAAGGGQSAGAFWGIDFNPSHISDAEQLKQAHLGPECYLPGAELRGSADGGPAEVRFHLAAWRVVLDQPDNRRAILDFIYAKLKPGGVVYISYNAQPGWSAAAPLRQLLVERLRGQGGATPDSDRRGAFVCAAGCAMPKRDISSPTPPADAGSIVWRRCRKTISPMNISTRTGRPRITPRWWRNSPRPN